MRYALGRLRAIPLIGWVVIVFGLLFFALVIPVTLVALDIGRPVVIATLPYATYPRAVCPGDVLVIEYRAERIAAGNQNLVAVSNWYNPASGVRYASDGSVYGAIFPEGMTFVPSRSEVRVPQTIPSGKNEYWRGIVNQPGSLFRIAVDVLPPEQCPNTEVDDQRER